METCCFFFNSDWTVSRVPDNLTRDHNTLLIEYETEVRDSFKISGIDKPNLTETYLTIASKDEANKKKNRHRKIPCRDITRVILNCQPGASLDSSYIHANYIKGYNRGKKFIASQAPMTETAVDFCNMIWQNKCSIIVVLTKILDDVMSDMYPYWSTTVGITRCIGNYTISTTKTDDREHYVIYFLEMKDTMLSEKSRKISLYHYTDWSIRDNPSCYSGFVALVVAVNEEILRLGPPIDAAPVVVHCGYGIGRTGIFCVVDICLEQWLETGDLNVLETVKRVRSERHSSVPTGNHYAVIFRILKEAIKNDAYY
uniref:protein-tyrosine-phosphatase n=1 Tax=Apophua simplicipes ichnovirus TaxID=1329648 RepID=S5DML0_9VIRU|nr:AsIV-cont00063-ORF1 [Apophua simplicipes ichnovirus]